MPLRFFAILSLVFFFLSCEKDPCETIDCGPNGVCVDGVCDCTPGYEGEFCTEEMAAKFTGNYNVSELCGSGSDVYFCMVSRIENTTDGIVFDNLYNRRVEVSATVNGNAIEIPLQAFDILIISGSGSLDPDTGIINLNILVDFGGGNEDSCHLLMER